MTMPERVWAKVEIVPEDNGCWLWTGKDNGEGYGRIWVEGRGHRAHRYVYEQLVGEIPPGLTLDHKCRVRHCVNPNHLRPMTAVDNVMIGEGVPAINARLTACRNGHPFTPENTKIRLPSGDNATRRVCKTCRREYNRKYMERWRAT